MKKGIIIMSQYINFYLRVNDKFVSLGSFSSHNAVYTALSDRVPYEKITAINKGILNAGIVELDREKEINNKFLKKNAERVALVADCKNSISEKMEEIDGLIREKDELEMENRRMDRAITYFEFLKDIIEDYTYDYNHGKGFCNNVAEYIYAGVEATGDMESIE